MARSLGKPIDTAGAATTGSVHAKLNYQIATQIPYAYKGVGDIYAVPIAAAGKTITAGDTAHTIGSYVEIDDGTNITEACTLIGVSFDTPSAAGIYELVVATGAASSEVPLARIPLGEVATDAGAHQPIMFGRGCGQIAASTRLSAAVSSVAGGEETINVKVILAPV